MKVARNDVLNDSDDDNKGEDEDDDNDWSFIMGVSRIF